MSDTPSVSPHQRIPSQKAVIVISSHVVRGSVGNRAAVFALEALGFPVWALQTVTLPWHPGHGPSTRIVPDAQQFDAIIDDLCVAPWLQEVGAILTGYLGDPSQAASIAKLVKAVKAKTPDALYICDPVIGDLGGLYVPEATAAAIKDELLPLADVTTPNQYELSWLSGRDVKDNQDIIDASKSLGPRTVLTTSAFAMMRNSMANLLHCNNSNILSEHRLFNSSINGAGDLTAALLLARTLSGFDQEKTLQWVTSSVFEILSQTNKFGHNELVLEQDISSLVRPQAMVQMRKLHDRN
ncbi:MAG: pyridoxal kinase PdxY [Lentilitoribacter sp.]